MESEIDKLLSLLFDKEAEIKELKQYILQLQDALQQTQNLYNKLYALHYLKKAKKIIQRKKIGFK